MAEVVGLVSGIASLVALAVKITGLSCSYIADTRSAHSAQKQYLREVNLLTEVLLRIEEVSQNLEKDNIAFNRPNDLFKTELAECAEKLEKLCSELQKPSPSIFWPIHERTLKKHVEDLHRFRGIFDSFLSAQSLTIATATHRNVSRLASHQDQTDLLEWLGNPTETSKPVPSPLIDTGTWFLNSEAYKQWVDGSKPSLLWCHGPPGVGKSMLAAVAIQDLGARAGPVPVLHYFFDFGNRKEQTRETIWKDLLRQVIAKGNASTVQKLVSFRKELGLHRPASSKDFSDALKIACADQQFVLVLDGSDEMETSRELKTILVPFANASLLVTSRDTPEIRSTLSQATAMEVRADADDMRAYVASRLEEHDLDDLIEKHSGLEKEILEKSQGIFLLVRLLVDQLVDLSTVKEMRKALQVFPTHLDEAFESSLQRINAQSQSHSALANRVMGWIVSAERKLQMPELAHGLATEEGFDVIDEENLVSSKTILKVCGGLVVLQGSAVSMVHITVHTWLRNRYDGLYHKDLAESCLTYLTMTSFSSGAAQSLNEMDKRLSTFPFFSYAAQCWRRHLTKAKDARVVKSIDQLLNDSGLRSAAFQGANYKNNFKCPVIREAVLETMPQGHSALHFASYWNLTEMAERLLLNGEEKNAMDTQSWTPLHWACFAQSQEAVETLISHGADANAKDSVGWTPLFWAVLNGDIRAVNCLLQHQARYTERDIHDWTALRWAVASLQIDIVKILLKHHTKLTSQSNDSLSIIKHLSLDEARAHIASYPQYSKRDIIDELEATFADSDGYAIEYDDLLPIFQETSFDIQHLWRSGRFDPPTGNPWRCRMKEHLRRSTRHSCDYDESESESEMSKLWKSGMLQSAIRDGKLLAVRLLLEAGAEVNQEARQTPLHAATFKKDTRFAEILIQHGAHMEAQNHDKLTPLQQAVMNGFVEVTRLLLSNGANANVVCMGDPTEVFMRLQNRGSIRRDPYAAAKTPLMLACGLSPNESDPDLPVRMVQLLLEYGADPNVEGNIGENMTAFHCAARARNPTILELLFDADTNVGGRGKGLEEAGKMRVYQLLFKSSDVPMASFDLRGHCIPGRRAKCFHILVQNFGRAFFNQHALSFAAVHGDWEIFQTLHSMGASFETNTPLGDCLGKALRELHLQAAVILIENGACVSSGDEASGSSATRCEWIRTVFLFSKDHEITHDEIDRFRGTMEMLISHGFNINTTGSDNCTLLHHAIQKGSPELVECLLDIGANPYCENKDGVDSFLLACIGQQLACLEYLLRYTEKHTSASHWRQHLDIPAIERNCDLYAAVSKALKCAGQMNKRCGNGTMLWTAANLENWAFVEELLICGADSEALILLSAAEKGCESVVKLLIDSGNCASILNEQGQTPLHLAAKNGHTSVVKVLIDYGAGLDVTDKLQNTPLHLAAYTGYQGIVGLLLSCGADPDAANHQGWRPLHAAAWRGHTEAAQLLLQAGADVGAATLRFFEAFEIGVFRHQDVAWAGTPLHLAAMAGSVEMVRLILQEKVDVNARTDSFDNEDEKGQPTNTPKLGPTALHIALGTQSCRGRKWYELDGRWPVFSPFERGASVELDKGRSEIASLLIERGANVDGVANHLQLKDVAKFEGFPQLWDKLRVGITVTD